jgi:hypothetical protein
MVGEIIERPLDGLTPAQCGDVRDEQRTLDQGWIVEILLGPSRRRQMREVEVVVVEREVNAVEFAGELGRQRGFA